jgi:hypothetical protein
MYAVLRIRSDPEISPSNPVPDPDPALVVFKKDMFLYNIVHMYIYLLRRGDSSIGIGKTTWHHKFNNDEICFCLVLRNVCPEKN